MSLRHIWALTRKEFLHIMRDRSTLILVLFTPTLLLLLMAYALTVDIKHVPLAVLDYDRTAVSSRFIQQITSGEDLDIAAFPTSRQEIDSLLMQR
jgi:ABC-2 type transport system permease protein